MIYLIRLPYFLDETGTKFGTILKFGFTDDYRSRKNLYLGNHLSIIELKKIDGGTLEDETRLKIYFKQEGYVQCKNEWLYDNEKTINFFNIYDTIDKIRELLDSKGIVIVPKKAKVEPINYKIFSFVISKLGNTQELWDELINTMKYIKPEGQAEIVCTKYGLSPEELQVYLDSNQIFEDPTFQSAQTFNETRNVIDKFKMLVEVIEREDLSESQKDRFLDLIPSKYRDYYQVVGLDQIRSCSYQESKIKNLWREKMFNDKVKDDLVKRIHNTFTENERYSKDYIKQTLKNLYSQLGYQKSAKASDLELYFYIKSTKTKDSTGKWVNGFEIIAKK